MIRFPLNKYIKFKKSYTNVLTVNHGICLILKYFRKNTINFVNLSKK